MLSVSRLCRLPLQGLREERPDLDNVRIFVTMHFILRLKGTVDLATYTLGSSHIQVFLIPTRVGFIHFCFAEGCRTYTGVSVGLITLVRTIRYRIPGAP